MKSGKTAEAVGCPECGWTAIGGIVPGAIHIRQDKPCQDAMHIRQGKNYAIACVADGHGSASCPHSDDGSKAAVKVAAELLSSMLKQGSDAAAFSAQREIWLPRQIEAKWKEAVKVIHGENGRQGGSCSTVKEPDSHESTDKTPFPYIQYGTTLLAIAATETFIFALQIGDGDMLMIDKSGTARPLLPTEEKVGEDTESLCLTDAWKYVRTQVIPWNPSDGAPLFLLSTDGYANSFANSGGFAKAGADFLQLWQNEGTDYISENLPDWLRISSDKGSGDDIALVLIARHPVKSTE